MHGSLTGRHRTTAISPPSAAPPQSPPQRRALSFRGNRSGEGWTGGREGPMLPPTQSSVRPFRTDRPWRSAPMQKLYNWLTREDGQTMAEYGVVLAVITIAVFGALALLSGNIVNALTRVAGYIT